MSAQAERYEIVATATSRAGTRFEILQRSNGSYVIAADGRLLSALYWRATELDRCTRVLVQLIVEEPELAVAA